MIIDCGTCAARDLACADCVVSVLLGPPGMLTGGEPAPVDVPLRPTGSPADVTAAPWVLDEPERAALEALAGSGLVPPLRLVPGGSADEPDDPGSPGVGGDPADGARKRRGRGIGRRAASA
jgi:hypothetical protein